MRLTARLTSAWLCMFFWPLVWFLPIRPPLLTLPTSGSVSISPAPLSANLFFAFYCLSLPALLWPVKLSPLTKWLMTKVNSPSLVLSVSAVSAPCAALKILIVSWTDENLAARSSVFCFFLLVEENKTIICRLTE